jgi:hypothetical protein
MSGISCNSGIGVTLGMMAYMGSLAPVAEAVNAVDSLTRSAEIRSK